MLDTTTIFIVDYGEEFLSLKGCPYMCALQFIIPLRYFLFFELAIYFGLFNHLVKDNSLKLVHSKSFQGPKCELSSVNKLLGAFWGCGIVGFFLVREIMLVIHIIDNGFWLVLSMEIVFELYQGHIIYVIG